MADTLRRAKRALAVLLLASLLTFPALASAQGSAPRATQPHVITGSYETTNPIYATIGARTGVALYDLTGQVRMDFDFQPPPSSQVLGLLRGDIVRGDYILTLPDAPRATPLDFDGDPASPPAVQVFATTTFIEFLGDEYINRGETPLDLSVRLEPMTYEVIGGAVIVWSANAGEAFPAALGPDGAAFTADDPLLTLPQGWSVVSLDTDPFTLLRDSTVDVPIVESFGGLNDYSALDYMAAWEALFQRTVTTYPFTELKGIDWDAIHRTITPLVRRATTDADFALIIAHFGSLVPDTHIGYVSVPLMQQYLIGGVGIAHLGLTDAGEIVVLKVTKESSAAQAGITVGSVLIEVDGLPALQALDETPLLLTSASTEHGRRYLQAATLLQGPIGSSVALGWRTPDGAEHDAKLVRLLDVASLLEAFGGAALSTDVISARLLDSGLGYIKVSSFSLEVSDADAQFGQALQELLDAGATGIILDLRDNSGGLVQLAMSIAGRFFPDYARLFNFYYADGSGGFAYRGFVEILPGAPTYDGPVAVLVNEMTGSAGDLFAYAMQTDGRALIVGHTPTGGAAGEISDGQYQLPGALSMQIPTGRPVDPVTGETLIEGRGVAPDVRVPRTVENLLSPEDEVLGAAERALLGSG